MTIKRLSLIMVGCCTQPALLLAEDHKEPLALGLEYTTELQTDFKDDNWVNLLQLSADVSLPGGFGIQAKTVSVAKTRADRLIDDLQTFSNIEEDDLTLAPAVLGAGWKAPDGAVEVFAGVRNMGEDYFATPCTSLFTGSSYGVYPTISAVYDVASYPLAAMCADLKMGFGRWLWHASVYNGRAYKRFTGSENVFRFCPGSDGVLGLTTIDYDYENSNYTLGCAVYHGYHSSADMGDEAAPQKKKTSFTPWLNAEQPVGRYLHLVAQASVNLSGSPECKHYEALAAVADIAGGQAALAVNHAAFAEAHEYVLELTGRLPLADNAYLQPACQVIRTGRSSACVGMLRIGITL